MANDMENLRKIIQESIEEYNRLKYQAVVEDAGDKTIGFFDGAALASSGILNQIDWMITEKRKELERA